jgi:O-antigen/teichoic acid export membrane protein
VEGVLRLVAGLAILAVAVDASALAWAMVVAPLSALLLRFWRHDREEGRVEPVGARRFLGAYIGGSSASQILLAGAPLGVAALGGGSALFSVVFVTFTLFRAPLTLIYSLQSRILPHLVSMAGDDDHSGLRRIAVGIVGVGSVLTVVGGLVGYLAGPVVVEILFDETFRPGPVVAMLAAGGVMAASTAQIGGQVLVARAQTSRLATAWLLGLAVALVTMVVVSGTPDVRVATGFAAGEVAAMAGVGFLVTRS